MLQGTAVVGLQLGTQAPLFSLVVAGESAYAATGASALLELLLLFLQVCATEGGGALGGRHVGNLPDLRHVLEPSRPRFDLVGGAVRLLGRYL